MTTATDRRPAPEREAVTVLGAGAMGSALAQTLIRAGYDTTVWNRTRARTEPLVRAGARAAASPGEAVGASQVALMSVLDNAGAQEIVEQIGPAGQGRVLINLTSGTPEQDRALAARAASDGMTYLGGAILGDPPDIGSERALLSISGPPEAFARHETLVRRLGTVTHHGDDPGAAAVEFLAQVAASFEFLIGYLHVLRVIRAEGGDLRAFTRRLGASLVAYPGLLDGFAEAVISGEYGPDLGTLDVQSALMGDLISHRESLGVEAVRMREIRDLMERRIAQGHGDQGFSSLIELLGAP